jgi:NAD(P)-dependent dehydrogenase (short-subunit alcohol dehydrogenase family)
MSAMQGKVVIVTGGGRGIGREECLLLAREGAKVVVNDLGTEADGRGTASTPAEEVVGRIKAEGGTATANHDDVTAFEGARKIIDAALDAFGRLDALVNNAGIVRDKMIFNMSEEDFDAVIAVHLRGHFNCMRWASAYWREQAKKGESAARHVVNTTSLAGLIGNMGQTNYGAAKGGIAIMTRIWALEVERFGVRVNAIAPVARTRLTTGAFGEIEADDKGFDPSNPAHVAPLAVYLASDLSNDVNGEVFGVHGGELTRYLPWSNPRSLSREHSAWTVGDIASQVKELL